MNITLLVLIIFVPLLALILLALNALLATHKAYEEKLSVYEAGMPVIPGQTRESFQIHYWLVAMLFLVFDIELVLLLPISVSLYHISTYGFVIAMNFFIVLTIGFIFEIGVGALTLKSEQNKHITPSLVVKVNVKVDYFGYYGYCGYFVYSSLLRFLIFLWTYVKYINILVNRVMNILRRAVDPLFFILIKKKIRRAVGFPGLSRLAWVNLLKILLIILVYYFFISIITNINILYEFNILDSMIHLSLGPFCFPKGPKGRDYINFEDYRKIFNYRSLNLKKKLQKLESRISLLNNLDLSIFNVIFENHEHIFLRHVDLYNCYKVEVSILKYNPNLRGNSLFYYLTYSELKFKGDLLIEDTPKFKIGWYKEVNSGLIGTGTHPLELYIFRPAPSPTVPIVGCGGAADSHLNGVENNNLKANDNQKIGLLKFLLIADEVINNFSNISSNDLASPNNNNDNNDNLPTRFTINGKLIDIASNLIINFKSILNNTNKSIKLTVNFNSPPVAVYSQINNKIKMQMKIKMKIKKKISVREKFNKLKKLKKLNKLKKYIITLIVFKNKLKLNEFLLSNKNGKIINGFSISDILKMKIKAMPSEITENNQLINSSAQAKNSISINKNESPQPNKNNEFEKQNLCRSLKKLVLNNNNIPIVFFLKHLSISINKYIEINNNFREKKWNLFLKSKQNNLSSTFLSVLTKDDKGKHIFSILHLNHFTGYINNYINIKTYINTFKDKKILENKGYKLNENLKLCKFILASLPPCTFLKAGEGGGEGDEMNNLQTAHKNNGMFINSNINLIQLSLNFLGSENTINNLRKNKLLKLLNRIKSNTNYEFEIIDITKYRKQECLQMFHIVYNNNPNIKLEGLIKNYNALIEKRKKTIENTYFNFEVEESIS